MPRNPSGPTPRTPRSDVFGPRSAPGPGRGHPRPVPLVRHRTRAALVHGRRRGIVARRRTGARAAAAAIRGLGRADRRHRAGRHPSTAAVLPALTQEFRL